MTWWLLCKVYHDCLGSMDCWPLHVWIYSCYLSVRYGLVFSYRYIHFGFQVSRPNHYFARFPKSASFANQYYSQTYLNLKSSVTCWSLIILLSISVLGILQWAITVLCCCRQCKSTSKHYPVAVFNALCCLQAPVCVIGTALFITGMLNFSHVSKQ